MAQSNGSSNQAVRGSIRKGFHSYKFTSHRSTHIFKIIYYKQNAKANGLMWWKRSLIRDTEFSAKYPGLLGRPKYVRMKNWCIIDNRRIAALEW